MRAGRLAAVEVDGERGLVIPGAGPGLRGGVQQHRADQRDPEAAGGVDDQLSRRVTRIDQVLAGQQALAGQLLMDRGGHRGVGNGRLGRGHAGDQVRSASATTGYTTGVKGNSFSASGTGVRGIETATTGNTTGVSAYVNSSAGTAGVFNNAAGGKILIGQNNGVEKFRVDGNGNVNALGTFTGSGAGLTGIQFSQLSGTWPVRNSAGPTAMR